jgi:hypothetical protein
MRQTISGLLVAIAMIFASAAPASAWCGSLIEGGGEFAPCADTFGLAYTSYDTGCGCGAAYERLPDPEAQYHRAYVATPQYYYVDQGPTYTGPGNFAPRRVYREEGISSWGYGHRPHYGYRHHYYAAHRYGYYDRPRVLHSLY